MTINELLTKERNQYIANFQLGLDQNKTDKSAIEIMLQVTADQNRNQPEIFQLNRYDMVTVNAQGKYDLTEFNLPKDSVLKFDKQVFDINKAKVEINPFVWNGCEFTLNKKPTDAYIIWAKKWIDIDDTKKTTADGFQNVIHSVTFPQEINGEWTLSIDFGSAPIEAFKELLDIFTKQQTIKKIEIHSKTFLK
jgi:hypothetical protein